MKDQEKETQYIILESDLQYLWRLANYDESDGTTFEDYCKRNVTLLSSPASTEPDGYVINKEFYWHPNKNNKERPKWEDGFDVWLSPVSPPPKEQKVKDGFESVISFHFNHWKKRLTESDFNDLWYSGRFEMCKELLSEYLKHTPKQKEVEFGIQVFRNVQVASKVELILRPKYMNDVFTWHQIREAIMTDVSPKAPEKEEE